jgi:uncharacterized protein (UPF0276 family)
MSVCSGQSMDRVASIIESSSSYDCLPYVGVGFKNQHYSEIISQRPQLNFFEVHAENYMGLGGPSHQRLTQIRKDYQLSLHGVGLSLGGSDLINKTHLEKIKKLIDMYQPLFFSEHLAWSTHNGFFLNDLLPLPYNKDTLKVISQNILIVQDYIGIKILNLDKLINIEILNCDYNELTNLLSLTHFEYNEQLLFSYLNSLLKSELLNKMYNFLNYKNY